MTISDHDYPKITESSFSFPEFVSACQKNQFIFSVNFWDTVNFRVQKPDCSHPSQNASTVSNVPTFHFPVEKHLVEQLDDYILAAAVDDEKQKKAMSQSIVATRFIII